jgi:hypothetical protein
LLLVLRLTLVPIFIAIITLAGRRWGPRAAAFVTALPAVVGPTFYFYAVQQGHAFAAHAAAGSLLGLVGVAAFCAAYGYGATRFSSWPACLLIGWIAFGLSTFLLRHAEAGALAGLVCAIASLLLVRRVLPRPSAPQPLGRPPAWDLPVRMIAAGTLVFVLTSVAARLGPELSGLLTPFPVATAILASFTHAQQGLSAVARFLRGYMLGLCSFAFFCFVLAMMLPANPLAWAIGAALAAQLATQAILLKVMDAGN